MLQKNAFQCIAGIQFFCPLVFYTNRKCFFCREVIRPVRQWNVLNTSKLLEQYKRKEVMVTTDVNPPDRKVMDKLFVQNAPVALSPEEGTREEREQTAARQDSISCFHIFNV